MNRRSELVGIPKRAMLSAAVVVSTLLQACVAGSISYLRIDAPDAAYFKSTCGGSVGAPNITFYPFHGIFISMEADPVLFGLHVPEGMVVQLESNTIEISDGLVHKDIHLQLAAQRAIGYNVPLDFRKLPDPFGSGVTTLGPLPGASANGFHRWYFFMGTEEGKPGRFVGPPRGLREGTVKVPPVTINGQRYPAQTLPIKSASYFTVMPVNC